MIIVSERKVTGTALGRILTEVKTYIDERVIGFEEFTIDPDTGVIIDPSTGLEIEDVDFCKYEDLYSEDILSTLDRAFNSDNLK